MAIIFILALCLIQGVVGTHIHKVVDKDNNTLAPAEEPPSQFFIQEIQDQVEAPWNLDQDLLVRERRSSQRGKSIPKNVQHLTGNPVGSLVSS